MKVSEDDFEKANAVLRESITIWLIDVSLVIVVFVAASVAFRFGFIWWGK